MLDRITVYLPQKDKDALIILAKEEFRDPRDQAALLIRQGLQLRGFLGQDFSEEELTKFQQTEEDQNG